MNEIDVVAPAHFQAASAKPMATSTCAANFVLLLRPRLRVLRTPTRSSAKPMSPQATTSARTSTPLRVKVRYPPRWPTR